MSLRMGIGLTVLDPGGALWLTAGVRMSTRRYMRRKVYITALTRTLQKCRSPYQNK